MIVLGDEYKGYDVDHINHNTCDNRKSNLRLVTRSQNNMNSTPRKHSSSQPGVSYHKNIKRWIAEVYKDGKKIHIGCFKTEEEAIAARKAAEPYYYGEYVYNKELIESSQPIKG